MLALPLSQSFIHRQTLANAVRFTTVTLSELESRIVNAGGRALEIEKRIFEELRAALLTRQGQIANTAKTEAETSKKIAEVEKTKGQASKIMHDIDQSSKEGSEAEYERNMQAALLQLMGTPANAQAN